MIHATVNLSKLFSVYTMQPKYCLILAAGFGTRMGKIGQTLPKVLWPVFEKSLLELQVEYARSLGIEKIFINLHHQRQTIIDFCRSRDSFQGVEFLVEEPEILDIGGGVHNLASRADINYQGNLLILNSDQFFYLPAETFKKIISGTNSKAHLLFSYRVKKSEGYNQLVIKDRKLVSINKNIDAQVEAYETYTGISIINLNVLKPKVGVSKFFDSVVSLDGTSEVAELSGVDYWDFGTCQRYWETCFKILKVYRENSNHPFIRFLVNARALKTWKINLNHISYHSKASQVINLNPDEISVVSDTILLSGHQSVEKKTINYNGIKEDVTW